MVVIVRPPPDIRQSETAWDDAVVTWSDLPGGIWWDGRYLVPPPPPPPPEPWPPLPLRDRLWLELGPHHMDLDATDLLHITELDLGYPEVRENVEVRPNAHGVIDKTKWFGNRVVTLSGKVGIDWESRARRQELVDRLAPFLMPGERPFLHTRLDDGRVMRLRVRADQYSKPQIANVQDISISFKSAGLMEGDEQTAQVFPDAPQGGRQYNLKYGTGAPGGGPAQNVWDRRYPSGGGPIQWVTNAGNAPADWSARLVGHMHSGLTMPIRIENMATEEEVVFLPGFDLAGNESVVISTADHSVLADGIEGRPLWSKIDFPRTTFWQLPPGQTPIRLACESWERPASMYFTWRDTSIL